jgi:LuxR family maltose regulon positive regulatory protein
MTEVFVQSRQLLEHDLFEAIVEFEGGDRRRAMFRASSVIERAAPQGYVRLFLDAGPSAWRLLLALERENPSPYVERLIRIATDASEAESVRQRGLSERELDIVRYLPTPLSSAEIAKMLFISPNTLKTHLRHIYRKLGVQGRRAAAEMAQELGIA